VYRANDASSDTELPAKAVVLAAGPIESARLLLLSKGAGGKALGNQADLLGRHFMMHLALHGHLDYEEALFTYRFGGATGQLMQWIDPPDRGKAGRGFRVHFSSAPYPAKHIKLLDILPHWRSGAAVVDGMRSSVHCKAMSFFLESTPDEVNHVRLSDKKDRFGDPVAHVHYDVPDYDKVSIARAREIHDKIRTATRATGGVLEDDYSPSLHYFGTCRMGKTEREGVTDGFGRVHGTPNVFVAGGAVFPTASGVNPTLTFVALALRTTDYMLAQVLGQAL
jgi:choline dehydrogenase-like flavoprotein